MPRKIGRSVLKQKIPVHSLKITKPKLIPYNPDGTITLYHGSPLQNKKKFPDLGIRIAVVSDTKEFKATGQHNLSLILIPQASISSPDVFITDLNKDGPEKEYKVNSDALLNFR